MDAVSLPRVGAPVPVGGRRVASNRRRGGGRQRSCAIWTGFDYEHRHPPSHGQRLPGPLWLPSGIIQLPTFAAADDIRNVVHEDLREDPRVATIAQYEAQAHHLESNGNFADAADLLERAAQTRGMVLGETHPDLSTALSAYVCQCNCWAMQSMAGGQPTLALELLKRAQTMIDLQLRHTVFKVDLSLRMATLHNFCQLYKSRGKTRAALQAAERASRLAQKHKEMEDRIPVLEVICAALLSMERQHQQAVDRLQPILDLLSKEEQRLWQLLRWPSPGSGAFGGKDAKAGRDPDVEQQHQDVAAMLAIASCNLWLELQHMGHVRAAADTLREASHLVNLRLDNAHPLAKQVRAFLAVAHRCSAPGAGDHRRSSSSFSSVSSQATGKASLVPAGATTSWLPSLAVAAALENQGCMSNIDGALFRSPTGFMGALREAADEMVESRITLRHGSTPVSPQPPAPVAAQTPRVARPGPPAPQPRQWEVRLRCDAASHGFIGSPQVQQQVHGVRPRVLLLREAANSRRSESTGADGSKYLCLPASARVTVLTGKDEDCGMEVGPRRLAAVQLMKSELRRQHPPPLAPPSREDLAATRIQACYRGFAKRRQGARLLAGQTDTNVAALSVR